MQNELRELLELLSQTEYQPANLLAGYQDISVKTVRNRLKDLDKMGSKYGVSVQSKPRYGYILKTETEEGLDRLKEELGKARGFPDNSEERSDYLLIYLLNYVDFIKIEQLSEFFFVSRSTLQSSIKEVEEILNEYHLKIERKPNYGIRVKGKEFDIRRCIGDYFIKKNMLNAAVPIYSKQELLFVADIVLELTGKYKIFLPEQAFENVITQIYVALKRMKRGRIVQLTEEVDRERCELEWKLTEELVQRLEEWQKVTYTQVEKKYIVIYLSGIRMIGSVENEGGNFVIREELDRLVLKMLTVIYEEYRIELRSNFKLRMDLNQHMVPFDIRMRYHILIHNPLLEEIKEKYMFAYTLTHRCMTVLEEYYGEPISEDEKGYFTILFAFSLEQSNYEEPKRVKILIVCGAGRGSSRMLRYKYEQEFGEYLEKIYICGVHEFEILDLEQIDYIFTTVPITRKVSVPIIEVGAFLEQSDIVRVKKVLQKGQIDFLDKYYREEQFLVGVEGNNKEEVIYNICKAIEKQRELPSGFYEAVLKREELAQTDFGNYIAIPHPYKVITKDTFVYVAILEKEILWQKHMVQMVCLVAVSDKKDSDLQKFYNVTTSMCLRKEMVEQVIREKDFNVLMQVLRELYYTM